MVTTTLKTMAKSAGVGKEPEGLIETAPPKIVAAEQSLFAELKLEAALKQAKAVARPISLAMGLEDDKEKSAIEPKIHQETHISNNGVVNILQADLVTVAHLPKEGAEVTSAEIDGLQANKATTGLNKAAAQAQQHQLF